MVIPTRPPVRVENDQKGTASIEQFEIVPFSLYVLENITLNEFV